MAKFEIMGLKELQDRLRAAPAKLTKLASAELEAGLMEWVELSVKDLQANTSDTGQLAGAVSYQKIADLSFRMVAQKYYAPFIEFGTKGRYRPIPGTEAIASQFRGLKGEGGIDAFHRSLTEWVKRKGIAKAGDEQKAAFAIMLSILRNGIKAQPFFFKQGDIVLPKIIERLKRKMEI